MILTNQGWKQQQTTRWYVTAYLHADDPETLPRSENVLDGLQFGGKRNYGFGEVSLKDKVVDLDALDYSRLEDGEAYILELVTPFVLRLEYPAANNVDVPWWGSIDDEAQLRQRLEKIVEGGDVYELETIDHAVVVGYERDRPVETAKNGIARVGNHSKYGFGEFRIKSVEKRPMNQEPETSRVIRIVIVRCNCVPDEPNPLTGIHGIGFTGRN